MYKQIILICLPCCVIPKTDIWKWCIYMYLQRYCLVTDYWLSIHDCL